MKKIFFCFLTVSAIAFAACNNSGSKDAAKGDGISNMAKDSIAHAATTDDSAVKTVTITYANIDAKASASITAIVGHYLHIKNALADDNGSEAASGAKAMEDAISKMDKSLLTVEQKKTYDNIEESLKEHAGHIGKNGDKIKHQRDHFSMMSEDVYDLAKAFGGGRALYHDHCPMYNENKGAMWISETKEIKNPYLGAEMPTCGSVEEIIK